MWWVRSVSIVGTRYIWWLYVFIFFVYSDKYICLEIFVIFHSLHHTCTEPGVQICYPFAHIILLYYSVFKKKRTPDNLGNHETFIHFHFYKAPRYKSECGLWCFFCCDWCIFLFLFFCFFFVVWSCNRVNITIVVFLLMRSEIPLWWFPLGWAHHPAWYVLFPCCRVPE